MTISVPKRSHEESFNDMQVDSDTTFASQTGGSVFQSISECFGSPEAYNHSSLEAKAQTLALLGSIDFKLEDLESHVLNTSVTPQIFAALQADSVLAEEAATCLKNLMTNEHLGSKCTRRLYALCLFPVLHNVLDRLVSDASAGFASTNFIEAIAVQIWCIASTIPAALPQITTSPLALLVIKRLASCSVTKEEVEISADNALLTALLVSLEDNLPLAESLLQFNPMFLTPFSGSLSLNFDTIHLNMILRLMCFLQLSRLIPYTASALDCNLLLPLLFDALQSTSLPEAAQFESNSGFGVKLFFECYELTLEAFELLIVHCGPNQSRVLKQLSLQLFYQLPTKFITYWEVNFRTNFEDESNMDRVRLVRRIFSSVGTIFTILEQFMISCNLPRPKEINFVGQIETFLQIAQSAPSADYGVEDELSGWLRAWLMAWVDTCDSDYPPIPARIFDLLIKLFFSSSSPVVLTNTCALVALLIPYAPESTQKDFCVFLNSLLCTDPFDNDHLEVLMAAVDGVTGIFDPQSKEWPAKSLSELKKDVHVAKGRLEAALTSQDKDMIKSIRERIHALTSLYRIL